MTVLGSARSSGGIALEHQILTHVRSPLSHVTTVISNITADHWIWWTTISQPTLSYSPGRCWISCTFLPPSPSDGEKWDHRNPVVAGIQSCGEVHQLLDLAVRWRRGRPEVGLSCAESGSDSACEQRLWFDEGDEDHDVGCKRQLAGERCKRPAASCCDDSDSYYYG